MSQLVDELKRRGVFRLGAAYLAVSWLLLQVLDVVRDILVVPDWVARVAFFFLVIGFPIALVLAWLYELTPEGIKQTDDAKVQQKLAPFGGRIIDFVIIGALSTVIVLLVVKDRIVPSPARSIAVLPFENRSALPEDAFFVDGIHDDILTQLATISSFDKVISRTSVERYRDTALPMPQIGTELGVTTIIEGGVQRAGDRVRINVQLIDAATDNHQWAETYQRELTAENIFAIQAEIAAAIVSELQATLSPQERKTLDMVPTKSMQALEHYFRGRDDLRKRTSTSVRNALDQLQAAVNIDPNFALAHATLADAYDVAIIQSVVSGQEAHSRAREHIAQALALDPELGEAYLALGGIESWSDPFAAESAYRKAISLSPNNSHAHYYYCLLLGTTLGKYAAALEHCEKALELDPLSPIIVTNTGIRLWGLDQLEEARSQFEKASELDPEFVISRIERAYLDWMALAKIDEAVKRLRVAYSIDPGNPFGSSDLVLIYLDLGDTERASFWINEAKQRFPGDAFADLLQVLMTLRQGDVATATESARIDSRLLGHSWTLRILRDDALERDQPEEARELYAQVFPELLDAGISELTASNFQAAVDLALVLYRNGESQQADRLIMLVQRQIQTLPRNHPDFGYSIADVQIHAMQGDSADALANLREAIDEGWRFQWWWYLNHDLALQPLHDEPEFLSMLRELDAEMAQQLERVREMDANGELAAIPE